jgi:hypothetical protein
MNIDDDPRDRPLPGEAEATQALIDQLSAMMTRDHRDGPMRRDVHIKMHGLWRAEFTVERDLPPELRLGLFAEARTYRAWVRSSNSANAIKPDGRPDIRGLAIKLMGVPGRKLIDDEPDAPTHDFILISAPVFPARDARAFHGLAGAVIGGLFDKLVYFVTHLDVAWALLTTFKRHANPLQIRYWSAVPYGFGPAVVKYGLTPHVEAADKIPFGPPENLLREAAVAQLAKGDAVFDFCVQFQTDPQDMPIEDPRVEWRESQSPMRKVATLRILPQTFDTDERNTYGENLSFTPWRSLPEHRPLGGINRTRKRLYAALSRFRHDTNRAPRREPTDWEA